MRTLLCGWHARTPSGQGGERSVRQKLQQRRRMLPNEGLNSSGEAVFSCAALAAIGVTLFVWQAAPAWMSWARQTFVLWARQTFSAL